MKNYVTIPGPRMAGLFSYVMQVMQNLSAIEGTEHKLYIKFDKYMLYLDARAGKNVWDYYFKQPFTFTAEDILNHGKEEVIFLENKKATRFPFIARPVSIDVDRGRQICKKYIEVKPHILDKVNNFCSINFNGKKYFSIHRRGTDHYKDAPILDLKDYFIAADKKFNEYEYGLICSDELSSINAFKKRYGNKIKFYDSIRSDGPAGIHYSNGLQAPYKMGEDVLIESILMSKSDHIIKTVSAVSTFAVYFGQSTYDSIDLHIKYP